MSGITALAVDPGVNRVFGGVRQAVDIFDAGTRKLTSIGIEDLVFDVGVNPATHLAYSVSGATNVIDPGSSAPPGGVDFNAQGLWWANPPGSESGWGVNIAQQGSTFFAAWFTYDETGGAAWYVMPNGLLKGHSEFLGSLYRVTGPSFAGSFDPSKVAATQVGSLDVAFSDSSHARFEATVNGATVVKFIVREIFASPDPTCVAGGTPGAQPNYTDLWWKSPAGSESGWGLFLTHQGDDIFTVGSRTTRTASRCGSWARTS
jgi:hypothetical protein